MDKPYQELARLVGKVLAKRWLNRTTEQIEQPGTQLQQHASGRPDMKPTEKAEADNATRQ